MNLSHQTDFFSGASWANGKWYAVTDTGHKLITCDTTTGVNTVIATLSSITGEPNRIAMEPR